MSLGENVRRLRQALGLTQIELAKRCGTFHPRISAIENGQANPTLDTLTVLATELGTTVEKLLKPSKAKACPKS